MPIEVEVEGQILEFPDGMDQNAIKAAIQKRFGAPQAAPEPAIGADPKAAAEAASEGDPIVKRATLLPFVERKSGKAELGVPGVIHAPFKAAMDLTEDVLYKGKTARDPEVIQNAAQAATLAVPGSRFPGAPTLGAETALKSLPELPVAANAVAAPIAGVARHLPGGSSITRAAEESLEQVRLSLRNTVEAAESRNLPRSQDAGTRGISDWLNGDGIPAGAKGTAARVKKDQLSEALKLDPADTMPGAVVMKIAELGKAGTPADVQSLLRAKSVVGSSNWGDIQSGMLYNLGAKESSEGTVSFSMQNLIKGYAELPKSSQAAMFGGENGIKATLDELVTLGPKLARLEKLAESNPVADWVGRIAGYGHIPYSPVSGIPALVGNWSLSQVLSRPSLGPAATGYVKAATDWALNPNSAVSEKVFQAQSLLLADALAKETGRHREDVLKELQANGPKWET